MKISYSGSSGGQHLCTKRENEKRGRKGGENKISNGKEGRKKKIRKQVRKGEKGEGEGKERKGDVLEGGEKKNGMSFYLNPLMKVRTYEATVGKKREGKKKKEKGLRER